jgi:hypothetical protein
MIIAEIATAASGKMQMKRKKKIIQLFSNGR